MPELPEVETIRRVLASQLVNRDITRISVNNPQVIAYPDCGTFCDTVTNQTIHAVDRKGKFLSLIFNSGDTVTLHLRMTGCLYVAPSDCPAEKHTHLIFRLSDDNELRFEDTRRFGRFWLIKRGEVDTHSGISKLGIEPFDKKLTAKYLLSAFAGKKRLVKECLLDQSAVCGIGNIYSDEILFAAKILPFRLSASLTEKDWETIAENIPKVLNFFIDKNAVSAEEYFKTKGKEYRNAPYLKVYGHDKEPCPVCGTALEKKSIGGRSSVYCPVCQK